MPLGGENVGTAYVRIIADGDGLDESIREQFDDSDGAFDDAGRDGYTKYRKGFEKESNKKKNQTALRSSLTKALARGDFLSNDFFKGEAWTGFRQDLIDRFGDAGRLAGDNLESGMVQGMSFEGLKGKLNNITAEIVRAERELQKTERKIAQERITNWKNLYAEMERAQRDSNREMDLDFERHIQDRQSQFDRLTGLFETYNEAVDRMSKGEETSFSRGDLIRNIGNLSRIIKSVDGDTSHFENSLHDLDRRVSFMHPNINRLVGGIDRLGDGLGKSFGRGSRNDFINIIGGMVRGIVRLAGVVPRLAGMVLGLGDTFRYAFNQSLLVGSSTLRAGLAGVIATLETSGAAIAAFAAGMVALVVIIGPLISLVLLLGGALIALVSTLTFGLIGALVAVAGALVPLAVGIGVVLVAFQSLDKAQKKILKTSFAPVTKSLKALGDEASRGVFSNIEQQARRLAPVIEGLRPLFRNVGREISGLGDYFIDALSGPGYQSFISAMSTIIPNLLGSLGRSIGNALGGLGGFFLAATPLIGEFLGWLERVTGEFARWANSIGGQVELQAFFERAGDSVKVLGDFLGVAVDFLSQLLDSSNSAGNEIFKDMANGIRDALDYLNKNPDAVSQFFSDAAQLADDLGEVVDAVVGLADAFDSADSRISATFIVKALSAYITSLGIVFGGAADAIGWAIGLIVDFFTDLGDEVSDIWDDIEGIVTGSTLTEALENIGDLVGKIDFGDIWDGIGSGVGGVIDTITRNFTNLPGRVAGAAAGLVPSMRRLFLRIPQAIPFVVGRIVGAFRGAPGRIRGVVQGVGPLLGRIWNRLPAPVRTVAGQIGRAFNRVPGLVRSAVNPVVSRLNGIWDRLPAPVRRTVGLIGRTFIPTPGNIARNVQGVVGRLQTIWSRLPGPVARIVTRVVLAWQSVPRRIGGMVDGVVQAVRDALDGAVDAAQRVADNVVSAFSGLGGRIASAIGSINLPTPHIPDIPGIPGIATGAIVNRAQLSLIGEDGPEAVVPLNRPLSQVDPSVRWLSAIAQGRSGVGSTPSAPGRTITFGDVILSSNTADPKAVAHEFINGIVAVGY